MDSAKEQIRAILIERGIKHLNSPFIFKHYSNNLEADEMLNDIVKFPHHFVLACSMDRQIDAEKAWLIPYMIGKQIGGQSFLDFLEISQTDLKAIFIKEKLHRYQDKMAKIFYANIHRIKENYAGDASNIWKGNLKSGTIVRRFLEFNGFGVKIANMAVNLLVRDFKIPIQDKYCIDISPDIQVMKVFRRAGFIKQNASTVDLLYCARELYPEYPGIFDYSAWEIGREWCKNKQPNCPSCYLNDVCAKLFEST